jgi:putative membrane protein
MSTARLVLIAFGTALVAFGLSQANAQTESAPKPEEFINRAAVSGIYEVEAGKIALNKTQNAELKAFALTMVVDHTEAGEELKKVAGEFPVPITLDSAHQDLIARLNDAKAGEFDRLYWEQQSTAHKDAVSLFTQYSTEGANGAEKGFAAKTLPVLQHHQEMLGMLEPKIAN